MDLIVGRLPDRITGPSIEIVERKGIGHPDSICDALAEEVSVALSRFYRDRFGTILHHNVDKVLLRGGEARSAFGGGRVRRPIEIYLAGRAVRRHAGVRVPVDDIALAACRAWFGKNMHALDPERDLRIRCLIRPGSVDLTELFARQRGGSAPLANDTSCGVGFAPLSEVERAVLAVDAALAPPTHWKGRPAIGEDTKIMAIRRGNRLHLTVACAQVDRYVVSLEGYLANKAWLVQLIEATARMATPFDIAAEVNAADGPSPDSVYITVTGTSAEAGDDGEAGRGNRANGLITPHRPMTMESVAGKNPISHVGKLYNIAAGLIADAIVRELPEIASAECYLVSRIGHPIDDPQIADVRVLPREPAAPAPEEAIGGIVDRHLSELATIAEQLIAGTLVIGAWPLRPPSGSATARGASA
jgi:S-adenosylmethionine synthetase